MDTNLFQVIESRSLKSVKQRAYSAIDKFGEVQLDRQIELSIFPMQKENYFVELSPEGKTIKEVYYKDTEKVYESKINTYLGSRMMESNLQDLNGVRSSLHYVYSSDDIVKEVLKLNPKNEIIQKTIYVYDEDKKLIEKNYYGEDGLFEQKKTFTRNGDGKIIKISTFDRAGIIIGEDLYSYNGKTLVQHTHNYFHDGGDFLSVYYTYDDKERLIGYSSHDGKFTDRFEYNEEGLLLRHLNHHYEKRDDHVRFVYTFDSKGNWLSRTHYRNNIPFAKTIRQYEFHA